MDRPRICALLALERVEHLTLYESNWKECLQYVLQIIYLAVILGV